MARESGFLKPTILLTDPEQRAALAAARAFGKLGWPVHTVGVSRGLAGRSRFVRRHHDIRPDDARRPEALLACVAGLVKANGIDVVLPVTDSASRALLGNDIVLGAAVAGPSRESYERASDKAELLRAAARCGLAVPRQVELRYDTAAPTPAAMRAPLVVKPSHSVVSVAGRAVPTSVRFLDRDDQLPAVLASYPSAAYPLLLQERIVGDGVGVFLLRHAGRTLLHFGHRRLREKPPAGGVSTYRESVVPPADLLSRCEALLDALGYEGAAMVEFKQAAASGEYIVMEINARLWGSVQLAIDAGVNFPVALVEVALGVTPAPASAVAGVRSVWELGELDHAIALGRRSARELHLPDHAPVGPAAALRTLLDHRRGDRCEVFRWADPVPFVAEVFRWVRRR